MDTESPVVWPSWCYSGETTSSTEAVESSSPQLSATKISTPSSASRKRRLDRSISSNNNNNGLINTPTSVIDYVIHNNNNNNHVKNERLSPGTPDTSSRSRSVTPSSASHPDTPPASDNPLLVANSRNYSDFMRSLAAKYNHANPNDYFSAARNGFPPPLDPRFKPATSFAGFLPTLPIPTPSKDNDLNTNKKSDLQVLNPFVNTPMFPPLIDMSSTQALIAMVRTAKEAELQNLLKNVKRPDVSSPLDLSSAGAPQHQTKRARTKAPSAGSPCGATSTCRAKSESPTIHEDISSWSVEDVHNFVAGIDICAEYAQNFRNQRIDGAGLPLLTEEHLTTTMNMKLGPALKLKSILAKKLGTCTVCLHCSHCHNTSGSPEPVNNTGNTSDSGGAS